MPYQTAMLIDPNVDSFIGTLMILIAFIIAQIDLTKPSYWVPFIYVHKYIILLLSFTKYHLIDELSKWILALAISHCAWPTIYYIPKCHF